MDRDTTLDYYNKNALKFAEDTMTADITGICGVFASYLEKGSCILDFGCGCGRDSAYFLALGYNVSAIDGSEKLCRIAAEKTGINVRHMLYQDFAETDMYDGIWACASLLHLDRITLGNVMPGVIKALHVNGVMYMSFKYGLYEGFRGERYFTDFTEESFKGFISGYENTTIEKIWVSDDSRPGRADEKWLNIILRKTGRD